MMMYYNQVILVLERGWHKARRNTKQVSIIIDNDKENLDEKDDGGWESSLSFWFWYFGTYAANEL